jgi:hypothetical protein
MFLIEVPCHESLCYHLCFRACAIHRCPPLLSEKTVRVKIIAAVKNAAAGIAPHVARRPTENHVPPWN